MNIELNEYSREHKFQTFGLTFFYYDNGQFFA